MRGAGHQNDHDDPYRMATDKTEMKIKRSGTTALGGYNTASGVISKVAEP
jgi:hypothetical protein